MRIGTFEIFLPGRCWKERREETERERIKKRGKEKIFEREKQEYLLSYLPAVSLDWDILLSLTFCTLASIC
jgi:hypothetical protein